MWRAAIHNPMRTYKVSAEYLNITRPVCACVQGVWRAAIYNPMRIYKLGYNLTTTKEGRCLNNCTGHGTCSEDAICHCHDNWTGGDCSVHAKGGCELGSRKAMPM